MDLDKSNFVIWITGLAGSGKTTMAHKIFEQLQNKVPVVKLDGDELRSIFQDETSYDVESRKQIAFRNARLAKLLHDQNINVIVPTIALFHDVQLWNRQNIKNYREIFLDVPMPTIISRDQKNLYSKALAGKINNVVGVDIIPEFPINPDYIYKPEYDLNKFTKDFVEELFINTVTIKNSSVEDVDI